MSCEKADAILDSAKADFIAVSLRDAVRICIEEASVNGVIASEQSSTSLAPTSASSISG
jgi:hypothetical protein